jgi:hypothetical protein
MESGLDDNAAELAAEMENFVSDLMMQPDREQVASEIGGEYLLIFPRGSEHMHHTFPLAVLQSIYGDNAIHLWPGHGSRVGSPEHTSVGSSQSNGMDTIRYVISLKYVSPFVSVFVFLPFSFTIISFLSRYPFTPGLKVFHPTRTYLSAFLFLYLLHTPPRAHPSCSSFPGTSVHLASTHPSLGRYCALLYPHLVSSGPAIPSASLTDFRASSNDPKHGTKTSSIEKR